MKDLDNFDRFETEEEKFLREASEGKRYLIATMAHVKHN